MTTLAALLSKEFSAPSSATAGIAAYSLEDGAKRTYPERAALLKPKRRVPMAVPFIYAEKTDCACGRHGGAAVLKAAKPSKVRDYVLPRLPAATKKISRHLSVWGKRWAKQIAAGLPSKKADLSVLRKGRKSARSIADDIDMEGFSVAVMDDVEAMLRIAHRDGSLSAREMVGIENDARSLVNMLDADAVEFAHARAAELVGKRIVEGKLVRNPDAKWSIAETTRNALRSATEDAIREGWSPAVLERRILDAFAFSEQRAEMIARTELAFAHVQGNIRGWQSTGVVAGKRSILADTHPYEDICDENEAVGTVPLLDKFPDGSMGPPYHPNCLCDIVPVLDDEMEGS